MSGSSPASNDQPDLAPNRLTILIAATIIVSMTATMAMIVTADIGEALGFSVPNQSWIVTAYSLSFGGLLIVGGRIADTIGAKQSLAIGLAVFTAASLAATFAGGSALFTAARAGQGIGAALVTPAVLALIAQGFHGQMRERAVAIFSASMGVSTSAGMIVGAVLSQWLSWRWIFGLTTAVASIVLIFTLAFLPRSRRGHAQFDLPGAALATATASGVVLTLVGAAGDASAARTAITASGTLVALALLIWRLRAAKSPLIPLELLSDGGRNAALFANAAIAIATTGLVFFGSRILRVDAGLGPLFVGLSFLAFSLPQLAASLTATRFITALGTRTVAVTGVAVSALGMLLLIRFPSLAALDPLVLIAFALVGIGLGAALLALNLIILSGVPRHLAGAVSGMLQTSLQLGAAIGISALVLTEALGGTGSVFAVSSGVLVLGALALLGFARPHAASEDPPHGTSS